MKRIIQFIFLSILVYSCEKDDVCIEKGTSLVNVNFLSNTFTSKTVRQLSIFKLKNGQKSIVFSSSKNVNSLNIPFSIDSNLTEFIFQFENSISDTISFGHQNNLTYINKACGFKTVFSQLRVRYSNNFLDSVIINVDKIDNETIKHISIFH